MTITHLGSDVEAVAKKLVVSLGVTRQFTPIQPTTKKRIDLGLKLNNTPHSERL
ncbi:hypothetical protein [Paraglaciecola psychrophila]|uniref:hypothetical protein n=1 Tax=Paraglaciecola psychrophila TaxID=326544 RepID=UPI000B0E5946|nr:hypothetical protein [Paraglaciecola psychrophila]